MGQAKNRGTKEERTAKAVVRNEKISTFLINRGHTDPKKINKVMGMIVNDPQKRNLAFDKMGEEENVEK